MATLAQTRIAYNRDNRDYDLFVSVDGDAEQYIGSAVNHSDGQSRIDDYVFNYYVDNHTPEAAVQVLSRPAEAITTRRTCLDCHQPFQATHPTICHCPDCHAARLANLEAAIYARPAEPAPEVVEVRAAPDNYRYVTTLYDRVHVNGELRLTHYHVYAPVDPIPHQSNAFVPVAREVDPGNWADAQDCYGNKLDAYVDLDNASASQAFPEEPIGDCALCGAPAWRLDETLIAPLCPDHKGVEQEWIANRDGGADPTDGGPPSPNDAPIPLPEEIPGNPSDGRAEYVTCRRDVLGERWTICRAPGDGPCYCDTLVTALPAATPAAKTIARTPCAPEGLEAPTVCGGEDAAPSLAEPATPTASNLARPRCSGYYSERWSLAGDIPCGNYAYVTLGGHPYCYICMQAYMHDHPQSTPIIFSEPLTLTVSPDPAAPTAAPALILLRIDDELRTWYQRGDVTFYMHPGCPIEHVVAAPPAGHFQSCSLCAGPHPPTRCPEVALAKYGMGVWDAYLENRAAFLKLVQWATAPRLTLMSEAVAFYLSHRWRHVITAEQVLVGWQV